LSSWPGPHSLTGSRPSRYTINAGVGTIFWAVVPWSIVLLAWSTLTHRLKAIKVYHIFRGEHNNGSDGLPFPSTFSDWTKLSHWLKAIRLYYICKGGRHSFLRGLPSTIRPDQINTLAPCYQGEPYLQRWASQLSPVGCPFLILHPPGPNSHTGSMPSRKTTYGEVGTTIGNMLCTVSGLSVFLA
jgi:hypothetical protein